VALEYVEKKGKNLSSAVCQKCGDFVKSVFIDQAQSFAKKHNRTCK
jgi:hypothetical protein